MSRFLYTGVSFDVAISSGYKLQVFYMSCLLKRKVRVTNIRRIILSIDSDFGHSPGVAITCDD